MVTRSVEHLDISRTFGYVQEHILARGIFAAHGAFDAVSCRRHLAAAICGAALGRRPMAGAHADGRPDFARLPSKSLENIER